MKISETERAAMSALGASLNQTDDVLAELDAANQRLAEAERLLTRWVCFQEAEKDRSIFYPAQMVNETQAFLTPTTPSQATEKVK